MEVIPKELRKQAVLHLIMNQIRAIYREEGKLSELTADERLAQRRLVVKPLVDAFFAYLKQISDWTAKNGLNGIYARNQLRPVDEFVHLQVFFVERG